MTDERLSAAGRMLRGVFSALMLAGIARAALAPWSPPSPGVVADPPVDGRQRRSSPRCSVTTTADVGVGSLRSCIAGIGDGGFISFDIIG